MRKTLCSLLALLVVFSLIACSSHTYNQMEGGLVASDTMAVSNGMSSPSPSYDYKGESDYDISAQPSNNQKWVLTAHITCESTDYVGSYAWIKEAVSSVGGYLESENEYGSSYYDSARSVSLTIRLPVSETDDFFTALGDVCNITRKSQSLEDVTLQYTDSETYIKALRTEQARLLELLEMADTVSDILSIEDRLTDVRYSLEFQESKLRTLSNQIDYSTVYLELREVVTYTRQPSNFFERAWQGFCENFEDTIEGILNCVLWFITHIPTLTLYCILAMIFLKYIKPKIKLKWKRKTSDKGGEG